MNRWRLAVPFAIFVLTALACAQQYDAETESLLERGRQANSAGHYNDAIKAFKQANKRQKNACSSCYRGMAAAYESMGNLGDADDCASKAVSTARDAQERANAHFRRGMVFMDFSAERPKRLVAAEAEFREALTEAPADLFIRFELGLALLKQSKDEEGIRELAVVAASPSGDLAARAQKFIANPRRAREWYAPEFQATTLQGTNVSLAELAGKVIVLDFWATWCPSCRQSIPELRDLVKKYPADKFVLISVSEDQGETAWKSFVDKKDMDWPQVFDAGHRIQSSFNIRAYPTYIVIDGEGVVRQNISGSNPQESLASRIKDTLKEIKELN